MKKFIAALAGAAIIATPLAASAATPRSDIPHGTLRCSSFHAAYLRNLCSENRASGHHWFREFGRQWELPGNRQALIRAPGRDWASLRPE